MPEAAPCNRQRSQYTAIDSISLPPPGRWAAVVLGPSRLVAGVPARRRCHNQLQGTAMHPAYQPVWWSRPPCDFLSPALSNARRAASPTLGTQNTNRVQKSLIPEAATHPIGDIIALTVSLLAALYAIMLKAQRYLSVSRTGLTWHRAEEVPREQFSSTERKQREKSK